MKPGKSLSVLILIACLPAAAQDPNVTIYAPGPPGLSMFDPANPPPELKPPEAAFCRFTPQGRMAHAPQFTFDGAIMALTGAYPVSISMSTTIFLPYNATDVIRAHENGHSRLCEYEYNKVAANEVAAAFAGVVGMRFGGRGATAQQRYVDAQRQLQADGGRRLNMAMQRIFQQVYGLNDLYDNLTRHGTNPDIDTAKGEEMAKQQFDATLQPQAPPQLQTQPQLQMQSPPRARAPAAAHRSRTSRLWAIGALVLGGLLLAYGFITFGRRTY